MCVAGVNEGWGMIVRLVGCGLFLMDWAHGVLVEVGRSSFLITPTAVSWFFLCISFLQSNGAFGICKKDSKDVAMIIVKFLDNINFNILGCDLSFLALECIYKVSEAV